MNWMVYDAYPARCSVGIPDWAGTADHRTYCRNPDQCADLDGFLPVPDVSIINGSDEVYRIASYIVSGVGFLCSGVIFKDGGTVRGINTAATLWCTAAIGVLASSGYFLLASGATGTLILSNLLFRPLSMRVRPVTGWEESEKLYRISITCREAKETDIRALLINGNISRTLYLNHLDSGDVVGDKVEVIAEYCSVGNAQNQVLEGDRAPGTEAAGGSQRGLGGAVSEGENAER